MGQTLGVSLAGSRPQGCLLYGLGKYTAEDSSGAGCHLD